MRNSSLVKGPCADNLSGLKPVAEVVASAVRRRGRGAFSVRRSLPVRAGGAQRSANAGMSNVKMRENRIRRKSKVSYATSFVVGLAGPKPRPQGVGDGQLVNIPAPPMDRFKAKEGHGKLGRACLLDMVRLSL